MISININEPLLGHILALINEYYFEYYKEDVFSDYYKQKLKPNEVAKIIKKEYEEYLHKKGEL